VVVSNGSSRISPHCSKKVLLGFRLAEVKRAHGKKRFVASVMNVFCTYCC
jgi:hypothetical protein